MSDAPAYAKVTLNSAFSYTWVGSTSDARALQTASGAATRIASTYFAGGSFSFDVNLTDGNAHRIALYLLDWDSGTRAESISISDAASGAVLDTRTFSGFHNGVYAVWNVQGHVLIQVNLTGGANPVVAGLSLAPVALHRPAAAAQAPVMPGRI